MNQEQVKSIVRQIMLFAAGIIAGTTFVSKFFTVEQVTSILTSDTVIGLVSSLLTGGLASFWGFIARSDKNMVAATNALPAVQAVITKPTVEGREIAAAIPAPTVVPAGTPEAKNLAQ